MAGFVSRVVWYLVYFVYRLLAFPIDYWFHGKPGMKPSDATSAAQGNVGVWPSKLRPSLAYVWNTQVKQWVAFEPKVTLARHTAPLKVGTFNVMFNTAWILDYVSATNSRWKAQLETIIPAEDFDVLCLNEVAVPYLELLLGQDWLRDKYYVSDINHQYLNPRGNLIIWKKTVNVLGLFRETQGKCARDAIVLSIATSPTTLSNIVSLHLSAIIDRYWVRRRELLAIVAGVERFVRKWTKDNRMRYSGSLFLGDLNFHTEAEGAFGEEAGLVDVWSALKGGAPGFTLDSKANGMLQVLHPASTAQMRLDRIYLQRPEAVFKDTFAPSSYITVSKLGLFANERIPLEEPFNYIWPSDHFGYRMTVSLVVL